MINQLTILVIDSDKNDSDFIQGLLTKENVTINSVISIEDATSMLKDTAYDCGVILMSNEFSAVQTNQLFKVVNEYKAGTPVLSLIKVFGSGAATKALSLGFSDYVVKPFQADVVLARVMAYAELCHAKKLLREHDIIPTTTQPHVAVVNDSILDAEREMMLVLTDLLDAQESEDSFSADKMSKVAYYLASLHPNLTYNDASVLLDAAPMHDIGNLTLPTDLVKKEGKYTEDEYDAMKKHTTAGYQILKKSSNPLMHAAAIIAHEHQEKWDGTGYPRGLEGDEIHIYGRIVALADVFDALLKRRNYREALSFEEAVDYINDQKGKHFDPQVVDLFVSHKDIFKNLYS